MTKTPTQERSERIRRALKREVNGWYTLLDRDGALWAIIRAANGRSYYILRSTHGGLGSKDGIAADVPNLKEAAWIIAESTDLP